MSIEKYDYLNMRTTNINVRISPLLKSALIERAAEIGLNLSDFIMHILTKEMDGKNSKCQTCQECQEALALSEKEVQKFKDLAEPFKEYLGEEITVKNEPVLIESEYDILSLMVDNFKIRK